MSKVRKTDSCWLWTGAKSSTGYGNMMVKGKTKKPHRVAYELFIGKIPDDLFVMHSCDTPLCVNPDHLSVGTNADNMADMASKGRSVGWPGDSNPNARLTESDVAAIRSAKSGYGRIKKLAEKFGVTRHHIWLIRSQKTWNGGVSSPLET